MKIEVKVPAVGESVTTAEIESWEKQSGDLVKKGEVLVILETDKASMEIPAEKNGRLEVLKSKGEEVSVDEVIAWIDTSNEVSADEVITWVDTSSEASVDETSSSEADSREKSHANQDFKQPTQEKSDLGAKGTLSLEEFSPAVRHLIASNEIDLAQLKGTGRGGRLTKEDILKHLATKDEAKSSEQQVKSKESFSSRSRPSLKSQGSLSKQVSLKPDQRREAMTRLRKVTAERLVQSQHNSATLTTFNEVDLSRIIEIRKNYQAAFIKKYGFKLGFMSFFVKAVVVALKEFPKINAFVDGTDIIYNDSQYIGIAVGTEKGLVVPVLFHAEQMSLAQIEQKIIEYKEKALARKLSPDDLLGGTFTISNGGVFGSLLSTPILNPPQSGILGMHKIEQKAVVRQGKIEIRPMMYLALSYDHRMVDGKESVSFLVKVKEGLEEPSRLLIDI